ncbi:MAG: hypothetical protein HY666_04190 [Chloroflexi bacterium]|nr:hypothetical protein [Chloroflexota bacterium]
MNDSHRETFEEFRQSFNYGSRTDLLFKFLGSRNLTDQDAAEFFRGLLEKLGAAFDSREYGALLDYVFQWQVRTYTPTEGAPPPPFRYDETPWTPLRKPLSQSRIALVSAAGLFVDGEDPLGPDGPTQEQAVPRIQEFLRMAPILSTIPRDADRRCLKVRHPGYDIRAALLDHNVVFPIDRLKELQSEGEIGELAEEHYSFVGASSQKRLLAEAAPQWATLLKSKDVDAILLVAA